MFNRINPKIALASVLLLALGACTAGSPEAAHTAAGGPILQFLLGLWHGFIGPITLIVEIINKLAPSLLPWRVHLYETHDTGVVYDIGFYLGLASHPIGWSRYRR